MGADNKVSVNSPNSGDFNVGVRRHNSAEVLPPAVPSEFSQHASLGSIRPGVCGVGPEFRGRRVGDRRGMIRFAKGEAQDSGSGKKGEPAGVEGVCRIVVNRKEIAGDAVVQRAGGHFEFEPSDDRAICSPIPGPSPGRSETPYRWTN